MAAGNAAAECAPLRLGYVDQHRPPYFLGSGTAEATPAGASVDMIREVAAIAGCQVMAVRLPPARLRSALKAGTIDMMSIEAVESDKELYALPLDAAGKLDVGKALRAHTVVFVRASDTALRNIDPARDFGQRWLGSNFGAPLVAPLRKQGFRVDDGALDTERNFEKLLRNRIDGYAISVSALTDMDGWVAAKYGNAVVRLERPVQTSNIWLAISKDYYARNPAQVTTMWDWAAGHGRQRFAKIVRKYDKSLQAPH
ncbi:amino acid ABC transporter substrate-binding protein [Massilia sp. RP-1-19]|uniref:Amino acid ABC transporter substrate-binding protein n=1 Tax=Massilia polaris TaxID=2728846 RepID=A0A848HLX6_9BURK|nr:hypothetical protein [Massilia polaris]NML59498.1 amino acid ABC transporter substrate-binding protein [Massilia polaris]